MENNKGNITLIKHINALLIALVTVLSLIVGIMAIDDWVRPRIDYTVDLVDGWTIIETDGSLREVSGNFSIGKTHPVTFFRTLPDNLDEDSILRIKCPYYSVDAYVDDELIYHAGPTEIGNITTTVGNVFALIPLKREYSGKQVKLIVAPRNYHYEVLVKDAAITTMSQYTLQRINAAIPYFILGAVMILISVLSFVFALMIKSSSPSDEVENISKGFLYMGAFGLCAASWIIADYHVIGMVTGRMTLSGIINYLSFMLCPFTFSGLMLQVFDRKKLSKVLHLIAGLNFLIQMVLFLLGVIDLPQALFISQIIIVLMVVSMIYFGGILLKTSADKKLKYMTIPAVLFIFFALAAVAAYIMNGQWILFVAISLTIFEVIVISTLLTKLYTELRKNIEIEQLKKIAYLDNLTGFENRRAYDEYIAVLNERFKNGGLDDKLSVIMLDVNGLKRVNDLFGHAAGDELIVGAADKIKEAFGGVGRCFRTGGDEFVVFISMEHVTFVWKFRQLKEALVGWKGRFTEGIAIAGGKADRTEFPEATIEELLEIADKRMYMDKQNYYASLLSDKSEAEQIVAENAKELRKVRYVDDFLLTKYTMPLVQKMAEVIPGGFFIYRENENRELIYHNSKVLSIYGCDTDEEFKELTGYTFNGMVHPEDFAKIQGSIDRQIDAKDSDGEDHVTYRIKKKDGSIRIVDDYGHFSHSEDYGDIYYVFINDVTDSNHYIR